MNVRPLYDDAGDEWWTRGIWQRVPYGRRVVGDDSRGGWSRPWANSLRPLLSLSSPMEEREREREREREPGIRIFFFTFHTSPQAAKRRSFRGGRLFFFFSHNYSLYM